MNYVFSNVVGSFVFDANGKIIDKVLFKEVSDYKKKDETEKGLKEKHKVEKADLKTIQRFIEQTRSPQYYATFRNINLQLTKEKIKASVNEDNLISQAVNSIMETDKVTNLLVKRLREWYSLYNPEFSESVSNNEKFAELIVEKSKGELLRELKVNNTMGADLKQTDVDAIMDLAKEVLLLFKHNEKTSKYIEDLMSKYCPNLKEVAGTNIGAKLIEHTGSLKRLVMLPASTIQLLGAEKALFRHIRTGARPPKYGLVFEHKYIQTARKSDQGKRARALADKISIAVKIDYFKGTFIGDKLKSELEEKFK